MAADVNERISAWFEPKPEWPDEPLYLKPSKLSYWLGKFSTNGVLEIKQPNFDFIHDEAANARLLEAMPEPSLWVESTKDESKLWACIADIDAPEQIAGYAHHKDRKTAVSMAFCRFAGIPLEDR